MNRLKTTSRVTLIAALLITLGGCDGWNPVSALFAQMGKDITDASKYAERMAFLISDGPQCQQYKDAILRIGREAASMNGGFFNLMVEAKNAANAAGCSKSP